MSEEGKIEIESGDGDESNEGRDVIVDEGSQDEPSGGSMSPSDELEAALQEASAAVDRAAVDRNADQDSASPDKLMLEALSTELQSLKQEHEKIVTDREEERGQDQDRYARLQAEFENYRRRVLKEREEVHNYGPQNLVKELLPTVDNLDRAIEHARSSSGGDLESLLQGVELVQREFLAALANHGVKVIEAKGQMFDPEVHEAMAQDPDPSAPVNTVTQVLQTGYMLRDRMLRPARVMVAAGAQSPGSDDDGTTGGQSS